MEPTVFQKAVHVYVLAGEETVQDRPNKSVDTFTLIMFLGHSSVGADKESATWTYWDWIPSIF